VIRSLGTPDRSEFVIPAKAGIQDASKLDPGFRRGDGQLSCFLTTSTNAVVDFCGAEK